MSCSMGFHSRLTSSSRIPSFEFVSGSTAVSPPAVRCPGRRSHTSSSLKVGIKIKTCSRRIDSTRCFAALNPELKTTLDKVVTSHKVILFMKGTKDFPQCGFSNTVVQILRSANVPFETINILDNEMLRQGLKEYSQWPTFPQLYIDGEFFGGCDITVEAYKSGELQELLEKASLS
ncbi:uncharacterized protein LOC111888564 [Lactuca sativa]|uniref:Glutaredoxin domain-containing protein n=2 Tax=Lactuca TaxID=4235 RepID=A0A9R1W9J0_LACSA|nr:uncharacterized protein LOC111888564 [Lactuca sativa]KAJ0219823.1 hypothetical protein LSAT_V11C200085150 [Lactuca sativa]CAH1437837.1 unnamed protein product [Lactuca virosa]